jgi:hypothetical protein
VTDHHSRLIAAPALELLGADLPATTDPETYAELVSVTRPSRFRYTPGDRAAGAPLIEAWTPA